MKAGLYVKTNAQQTRIRKASLVNIGSVISNTAQLEHLLMDSTLEARKYLLSQAIRCTDETEVKGKAVGL